MEDPILIMNRNKKLKATIVLSLFSLYPIFFYSCSEDIFKGTNPRANTVTSLSITVNNHPST
ncbi:MAG: hypothetical protein ABI462_09985 [Ignavibacteria bacterium]